MKNVNPLRLRFSFASEYLHNNGTIVRLLRLLEHSSLDMIQHYLNISQSVIENTHRHTNLMVRCHFFYMLTNRLDSSMDDCQEKGKQTLIQLIDEKKSTTHIQGCRIQQNEMRGTKCLLSSSDSTTHNGLRGQYNQEGWGGEPPCQAVPRLSRCIQSEPHTNRIDVVTD